MPLVEAEGILQPGSHLCFCRNPKFIKPTIIIQRLAMKQCFSEMSHSLPLPPKMQIECGSACSCTRSYLFDRGISITVFHKEIVGRFEQKLKSMLLLNIPNCTPQC